MDANDFSDEAKGLLKSVIETGEKWLAEEIKKICDEASDEKDFLEEATLYLTRMELKIRALKEAAEKLAGL